MFLNEGYDLTISDIYILQECGSVTEVENLGGGQGGGLEPPHFLIRGG